MRRGLDELVDEDDPAWPLVQEWLSGAVRPVEVLPPAESASESLLALQVTTRSPLGSIVFCTGGILVDSGWIRMLGSGHPRLPRSLPQWNRACGLLPSDSPPPYLLIGDDALGGFFALNGGAFGPIQHNVWYFAPDTLKWEDLGRGYSEFLWWCLRGDVAKFYENQRWPGWETEVGQLEGDRAIHIVPPLFLSGPTVAERSRRAVPIKELFQLHVGAVEQ